MAQDVSDEITAGHDIDECNDIRQELFELKGRMIGLRNAVRGSISQLEAPFPTAQRRWDVARRLKRALDASLD